MNFNDKKYLMFDMDGTLLDSMQAWSMAGPEYAKELLGEDVIKADESFARLSVKEGLKKLAEAVGPEKVSFEGFAKIILRHYLTDVSIKEGVVEFLDKQKQEGKHMCIITATPRSATVPGLEHLGLLDYFDFILTNEDSPNGKGTPDIFYKACEMFGCNISEAAMFEDALYSIKTSTSIGLYTVAVGEKIYAHHKEEILKIADEYYENGFSDILKEVN